jgi:hypothetical protein
MAKKAKPTPPKGERLLAQAIGPLGVLLGMPAQVRLAGREQQPIVPPKAKAKEGKRK